MTAPGSPQGWSPSGAPAPGQAPQAPPGYPPQGYPPPGYPPPAPGQPPYAGPMQPGPMQPGPMQPGPYGRQPGRQSVRFAGGFTATGEVRLPVRANPIGAGVAGLGLVLALIGGLALEWTDDTTLPDLVKYAWNGGGLGASNSVETIAAFAYAAGVCYLLIVAGAYQSLMVTLGGVRTRASARVVLGVWGSLAWNSSNPVAAMRTVSGIGGAIVLALHIWGVVAVFDGNWDQAGPGPWVFLAGALMFPIAGLIGPRTVAQVDQPPILPPGLPRS